MLQHLTHNSAWVWGGAVCYLRRQDFVRLMQPINIVHFLLNQYTTVRETARGNNFILILLTYVTYVPCTLTFSAYSVYLCACVTALGSKTVVQYLDYIPRVEAG
jgi:hypothetical protein